MVEEAIWGIADDMSLKTYCLFFEFTSGDIKWRVETLSEYRKVIMSMEKWT